MPSTWCYVLLSYAHHITHTYERKSLSATQKHKHMYDLRTDVCIPINFALFIAYLIADERESKANNLILNRNVE